MSPLISKRVVVVVVSILCVATASVVLIELWGRQHEQNRLRVAKRVDFHLKERSPRSAIVRWLGQPVRTEVTDEAIVDLYLLEAAPWDVWSIEFVYSRDGRSLGAVRADGRPWTKFKSEARLH